ncbi:hypothetical protein ZIOFF_018174 [Zingiber officinale]|uniref:BHLH domain-containing protein n=1 Tax=Zingiber officinale TaxID=94328 RepID=A0A8J5HG48_ZINOF|nr:hypothetical protein ZIOFF_018174 [Zingiber officinale]
MDSFFLLGPEARRRFLQIAGRLLGCTYICSWSPLHQPTTTHLVSTEGWHCAEDSGQSSSSAATVSLRLFEAYRRSLCAVHSSSSSIPGLAYKDGLAYIQFTDRDIMNLASNHSQRQFYQVNLQMNIQQVFSEELIQQSLGDLAILPSEPGQLSSSSSDTSPRLLAQSSPPFVMQPFNFAAAPRTAHEDEAMRRAMLAVIISSKDMPSPLHLNQQTIRNPIGAFRPYYNNPSTAPEVELEPNWHGQRMIKIALHMLRRISVMKSQAQEHQQPTRSHSHHVISERKRREKLNEQFNALKALLPLEPKIKKDKATLLVNTKNYLNLLKAQIKELEEKNRVLEMQVLQVPRNDEVDALIADSDERIQIQVIRLPESTSEAQQIDLQVVVKEECDMIDWVIRVLECLKEMTAGITLVSMETRTVSSQNNIFGRGRFRLQIQTSDWDEATFKEAVSNAVANVLARVRSNQARQT